MDYRGRHETQEPEQIDLSEEPPGESVQADNGRVWIDYKNKVVHIEVKSGWTVQVSDRGVQKSQ